MKPYRLTEAAIDDLFEIWTHIASDDPGTADRLEDEFTARSSASLSDQIWVTFAAT